MNQEQLEHARDLLARSRRIVSFSGAGLSAESGVPTFRDAQEGLWAKFDPMMLASPEGFARDPAMVIDWYNWRRQKIANAQPNAAHRALASRGDIVNVTQNVDDLLERAGAGAGRVVHLHGVIGRDRCNNLRGCSFEETIDLADPPPLRSCPECGDRLRPAVVWFGEALPQQPWADAEAAVASCDTLLVVGTSALVYPAAGLIDLARQSGAPIVIVNVEPLGRNLQADVELVGPAGAILPSLLEARDGQTTFR